MSAVPGMPAGLRRHPLRDRCQIQDLDDEARFDLQIYRVPDKILISASTSDSPKQIQRTRVSHQQMVPRT